MRLNVVRHKLTDSVFTQLQILLKDRLLLYDFGHIHEVLCLSGSILVYELLCLLRQLLDLLHLFLESADALFLLWADADARALRLSVVWHLLWSMRES